MPKRDTEAPHRASSSGSLSLGECCNTLKNDPAFRGILLHEANDRYIAGKHQESIERQIEALCLGFRTKFFLNDDKSDNSDNDFYVKLLRNIASHHADTESASDFKPVLFFGSEPAKTKDSAKTKCQEHVDPKALVRKCRDLPEEWIVLQLCKNFDPNAAHSLQSEIISSNQGIFLTLLKYPRADLNNHEPLCVYLPPFAQENLYKMVNDITQEHRNLLSNPGVDREIYWSNLRKLDEKYLRMIDLVINWIGPWIVLFQGRSKSSDNAWEMEIFANVDLLAAQKKLSNRQRILLSIISCSLDLLSPDDVEIAAKDIARDEKECKIIKKFLNDNNFPAPANESARFPTIIIVDELLDQFPWELMLPSNEMSRVSSLHILLRLFEKYQKKIKNGYLHLDIKKGSTMINPESDLPKMEQRVTKFLNYWLPEWKQIVGEIPKSEEFRKILESADIFLFCGHGNALKYIKPEDLIKDTLNCVVMLFGCDSVKLKADGFCSEMTAVHLYYHSVLCPLVIGSKNIITDSPTDKLTARVLSTWFKSKAKKHFALCSEASFRKGEIEFVKNANPAWENLHNPSILGIFADIRSTDSLPIYMRAAIDLRGLPIWLTSK
ncbi:uncharacterized protein LOC132257292 [Phlebotomus argentipes]|uniref:uncharacterized protein LOC132257292 n=1 Tax=Phlebotomus argentipes TaxID=94469 RepID=UPI002892F80B|nr:uncharacterized protein LOC132257292 [Phlebotomus argentipes]XP_059610126.1 uncharacterized protein LOC132257292 [Phlebotomus argentipes]XP_059610127.1 uncharacterized protein LOC132257292 [Phlebotomus argentipes]